MLVLSRKLNTKIVLGENRDYVIEVTRFDERQGIRFVEFVLSCPVPTLVTAQYASELELENAPPDEEARLVHRFWMSRNSSISFCEVVTIYIVDIRPEPPSVRFGCVSPNSWPVHRLEVWEAIQRAGG